MRNSRTFATKRKTNKKEVIKFRSFVGSKLTIFPYIPPTSKLEEINISNNDLISFKGMTDLQNLVTLRCDNTKIASFLGAKQLPSLKKLFIGNTPLSHFSYYRIMALIVFGSSLEVIDFVNISKSERNYADNNRELLFNFLVEGWILTIADPIKLFNVNTRQRRVLFQNQAPISSSNSPAKSPIKIQPPVVVPPKPIDIHETKNNLLLIRKLHMILFEKVGRDSIYKRSDEEDDDFALGKRRNGVSNEDLLASVEKLLVNDEAFYIFVKMTLMAVNSRPLHIKEIVKFISRFKTDEIVSHLNKQIPVFTFNSYPILSELLENLLEAEILKDDDVKPYFFSVYDRFEDWNSSFVLFESNRNLSIKFLNFFCVFSKVIQKVDADLYNNLQNQLGDDDREKFEAFQKIHELRGNTIKTLLSDDILSYASVSEAEVIQNILDYTPWTITSNVKSAAAAFSGSEYCFLQYSLKGENFNLLFTKVQDQENTEDEENDEMQKLNLIDIKNEDEVLYFAVAGGNEKILQKFKVDESECLIDYASTAIQYHRFNSLNQIFTRVTKSTYFKLNDDFFNSLFNEEEEEEFEEEEEGKKNEQNSSLVSDFSRFYSVAAKNLDYCSLIFLAKKKIPFDNSVLNSVISKAVVKENSNLEFHTNSFLVHFLLNIGFLTDNCLFLSVQNENIEAVKAIINRFDSKKYDIVTDETKIVRIKSKEKREILKKIANYKGEDNLHWTPLHVASCFGNLEIVELLSLREEVDINVQDTEGNTPLTIAVSKNHVELVKFFMKLPKISPNLCDNNGWSPLAIAVGNNYVEIVQELIDNKRTDVNLKTKVEGATPMMIAVDTNNFQSFALLMKREDVKINEISLNGKTALSMAIEKERINFITALVKSKKVNFALGNAEQLLRKSKNPEIRKFINFI